MSKFPRIKEIKTAYIDAIGARFYEGVALCGDGIAVVGCDVDMANTYAKRAFRFDVDREGAEGVVMISPDKFRELLKLAGIDAPKAA
jgi:hypothetical protein